MKRSDGRVANFFPAFSKLIGLIFAALLLFCCFFEQPIPKNLLEKILAAISTPDVLCTADSASFNLRRGVKVRNLRVFGRGKPGADPILSAASAAAKLNLAEIPWSRKTILKRIEIDGLSYPRLPEGYYIPDSIEFPGEPDFKERNSPVHLELPELAPFSVTLTHPHILGLEPESVTVKSVSLSTNALAASGIAVKWKETGTEMSLLGHAGLDLAAQKVHGQVKGFTRQRYIRPLLQALDITNSYQFVDAFTGIEAPIASSCRFDVNLVNGDLHLLLDLHPRTGAYNQVPFLSADGQIDIRVFVRDTFQNAEITVGPLEVKLADASAMSGTIVYRNTNDIGFVDFDVRSTASLSNALAIADVLNDGTLDCIAPRDNPYLTLNGRLAVTPGYWDLNNLRGSVKFRSGEVFSIPLEDVEAAYALRETTLNFTHCTARAPRGGSVAGAALLTIPEMKQDNAAFHIDLDARNVALADVADAFDLEIGERHGTVNGKIALKGPIATNCVARLGGGGRVTAENGHLMQMKIFAGLTDFLADQVPGISSIVNQSEASCDFTIENGVIKSESSEVRGNVFSITMNGQFDLNTEMLDMNARLTLSRNDSFFSKLATPFTWPVSGLTKILFDFRIHGPRANPELDYNKNPFTLF